ncbi:MAG: serpin family protein [Gemmataceae bacterium]
MARVLSALVACALAASAAGPPEAHVRATAEGNNAFGFDLYRQLAKEAKPGENICFSPYSVSTAMALAYAGARGKTAKQMSEVLRFDPDQEKFHPAFAALSRQIRDPGKGFEGEVHVANAMWTAHDVRAPFRGALERHYGALVKKGSFASGEAARKEINAWVAEQTRKRITALLPPDSINSTTTSVLVNALYLRAKWQTVFHKPGTRDGPFHRTPTEKVEVPMMRMPRTSLRYAKLEGAEVVELPYKGGQFAMVLLLPERHDRMDEAEKRLGELGDWIGTLRDYQVDLSLPKFKLSRQVSLRSTLKSIGLIYPFAGGADFSGISETCPPINAVYHQATLDVDETGTTAAAATAIVIGMSGFTRYARLTFNRPFLLCLRDVRQGSILFVARVASPAGK